MNKDTKCVPIITTRERSAMNRFQTFYDCSKVLKEFYAMGFKSYAAFKAIMSHVYSDVDLVKLKRFWNCIGFDADIATKVNCVLNKLKNE